MAVSRHSAYAKGEEPPPTVCVGFVWALLGFVFGWLCCRLTSECTTPTSVLGIPNVPENRWEEIERNSDHKAGTALVHTPASPVPINHLGKSGETSSVLKRMIIPHEFVPHLVHLSTVDFGMDETFPTHTHSKGFYEVFLITSGCGEMIINGQPTGKLTRGQAVHIPPFTPHEGRALRCLESADEHFTMAYFAIERD